MGPLLAGLLLAATSDAGPIDIAALDRLPAADVVLLGEVHDNPIHHDNQARLVTVIRPKALVFEMFAPDRAEAANAVPRDDLDTLDTALNWSASGWFDFATYHPIFLAAPDAALFGGAVPRTKVRQAVKAGAAEVFGPGADRFGLDEALETGEQARREAMQMAAHCDALPETLLPGMVEAQRLRDAAMARAVLDALDQTGGPVVLITGNGHARTDWGVPRMLRKARPGVTLLSVGQFETAPEGPPFDLWLTAPAPERPYPCATFDKG